jgi:hypothetical protein
VKFVSPQELANLASAPRAFNDQRLIELWIYCGSGQTFAGDRRAQHGPDTEVPGRWVNP